MFLNKIRRFSGVALPVVATIAFSLASPARGAISVDAIASNDQGTASPTVTSPAFSTTTGNELLLAFVSSDGAGPNITVNNVTGAGLTWVLVVRTNVQLGTAEIWRAFAPTALTNVSVTASLSQSVTSSLTVMSFTGVDTSGTNGSGAIGATGSGNASTGAPTATLITTRNNSWVFGVGDDWDKAIPRTLGPNQTLVHQYMPPVGDTYWVQMQNSPTPLSGTSVTINDTAPTGDQYNLSVCEILPQLSGSTLSVSITAPTAGTTVSGTTTVSATASSNAVGVQFLLDGLSLGTEVTTVPYSIQWDTTTAADGPHTLLARAHDAAGNQAISAPVAMTVSNDPSLIGQWAGPFTWPLVAVHAVLLNTGKVLVFALGSTAQVWDPATGNFTSVPDTLTDVFCAGHVTLADGRVLVIGGGGGGASLATRDADIFDPQVQTWSLATAMNFRRWYPTATILPDGRVLATAGSDVCGTCYVPTPEIYDPRTSVWTALPGANSSIIPNYPFMFLLPDGRVLQAGASEFSTTTQVLDVAAQTWSVVDSRNLDGGSAVMYSPNKIMKAGTASDSGFTGPAAPTTYVLDMAQVSPTWRQTTSMAFPRAFINLALLPDGSVLASGGERMKDGMDVSQAVKEAEIWSPATETWTTMSAMQRPRLYHSIGLLLPDARVLVSGGGADAGVPDELSAEIFSPPYLFKGPRPTISSVPANLQYGTSFFVATPDASTIASVSLIRPGAVTHFFNHDQRILSLSFQQVAGGLNVQPPADANLAPPGYYMLFILNASGVPSIASFVKLVVG